MDLEAIKARVDAVKSGPWTLEKAGEINDPSWIICDIVRERYGDNALDVGEDEALGEFVAAARTDVPALVARVRELEDERSGLLAVLREAEHTLDRHYNPYGTAHAHNCMYAVAELRRLLGMHTHEEP